MKKTIKLITTILVIALLSTMLIFTVSCNKNIKVATEAQFAPFEYKDGKEFAGIDMELIKTLMKKAGLKYEIVDADFDGVVAGVSTNVYDIAIAALTITPERAKSVIFSESYFETNLNLIVKKDNTDFDGLKTKEEIINKILESKNKICYADGHADTMDLLESWKIDINDTNKIMSAKTMPMVVQNVTSGITPIALMDGATAEVVGKINKGIKVINVPLKNENIKYAIAFSKKFAKQKADVVKLFNDTIIAMKKNGSLKQIIDTQIQKAIKKGQI